MIPDIASLSYEEVKDTEYIDFLDDVVEEGIDIVLTQIVNH